MIASKYFFALKYFLCILIVSDSCKIFSCQLLSSSKRGVLRHLKRPLYRVWVLDRIETAILVGLHPFGVTILYLRRRKASRDRDSDWKRTL